MLQTTRDISILLAVIQVLTVLFLGLILVALILLLYCVNPDLEVRPCLSYVMLILERKWERECGYDRPQGTPGLPISELLGGVNSSFCTPRSCRPCIFQLEPSILIPLPTPFPTFAQLTPQPGRAPHHRNTLAALLRHLYFLRAPQNQLLPHCNCSSRFRCHIPLLPREAVGRGCRV